MPTSNSARFLAAYSSLSPDAQLALVERHLAPLLDSTISAKAKPVLRAAKRAQMRHAGKPVLDLRAKKAELSVMLDELSRDIKRAFVMEGLASRFELLTESVASLANWLGDIWTVSYELQIDFKLAHDCLLFVDQTLERIANIRAGCKCALTNMYIPVTLKTGSGRHIKTFNIVGAHNLHKTLEFIWRDMFLTMLASSDPRHNKLIPGMLEDIEAQMGWKSVLAVFYGGKDRLRPMPEDDEDDDTDSDDDEDEDGLSVTDDDEDNDFTDEDSDDEDLFEDEESVIPRHCRHWNRGIRSQISSLRMFIQDALVSVFETRPSTRLFACLIAMSPYPGSTSIRLLNLLKSVATANSDTFATALEIYACEKKVVEVTQLLDSHAYLLRPRDSHALQRAVVLLASHGQIQRALKTVEDELMDTAKAIRHSLLLSYSQLDLPANKTEATNITKTRPGSVGRRERVELWVDAITTPGAEAPNPFVFAALMMGMPAMPGMHQDDDQYTYLDFDPSDPDMDELRAEFRPALKQRFESWSDLALSLKNGPGILLKVYREIIDMMPFLRATDATEEMIARLQDRTSKQHVCEGLDALLAFTKVQRRKWNTARNENRKRKEDERAVGSSRNVNNGSAIVPGSMSNPSSHPPKSRSSSPPPLISMSASASSSLSPSSSVLPSSSSVPSSSSTVTPSAPSPSLDPLPPVVPPAAQAPSFASFSWTMLGGPPQPPTATPGPVPPSPAPVFAPFSFFFGGSSDDAGFELETGPSSYGGGIDDVD